MTNKHLTIAFVAMLLVIIAGTLYNPPVVVEINIKRMEIPPLEGEFDTVDDSYPLNEMGEGAKQISP